MRRRWWCLASTSVGRNFNLSWISLSKMKCCLKLHTHRSQAWMLTVILLVFNWSLFFDMFCVTVCDASRYPLFWGGKYSSTQNYVFPEWLSCFCIMITIDDFPAKYLFSVPEENDHMTVQHSARIWRLQKYEPYLGYSCKISVCLYLKKNYFFPFLKAHKAIKCSEMPTDGTSHYCTAKRHLLKKSHSTVKFPMSLLRLRESYLAR